MLCSLISHSECFQVLCSCMFKYYMHQHLQIPVCNFPNFNPVPQGSAGQKGCEISQKRGVPGSREHFAPIQKVCLEGFPQLEAYNLLWLWAGTVFVVSFLTTAFQIMRLSMGIIIKPLWMTMDPGSEIWATSDQLFQYEWVKIAFGHSNWDFLQLI